jgi:uncharacterized protein YegL
MATLIDAGKAVGAAVLLGAAMTVLPAPASAADASCAPLDVAFLIDDTGSMDNAIDNVKEGVVELVDEIDRVSGGDYRVGLVAFGEGVEVYSTLEKTSADEFRALLDQLGTFGGDAPEAWDEALTTAVDLRSEADVGGGDQSGRFSVPWRADAKKLVVLVTDARPAGFDDTFDDDDETRAYAAAVRAGTAGIRVATIFVPNGQHEDEAPYYLQQASDLTGSTHFATNSDGSNLAAGLELNVATCAADSDGDGLFDEWETKGYDADGDGTVDVDLPAMGARPDRRDLFLQVNWMAPDGAEPCFLGFFCRSSADGPHPPDPDALRRVVQAFANAPLDNPDGTRGIIVHIDAGPLSPDGSPPELISRGGALPEHSDYLFGLDSSTDEQEQVRSELEARYFPAIRAPLFTWVLYVHSIEKYEDDSRTYGRASGLPGDTVMIAEADIGSTGLEAATLFHEIGHTLGLRHGGLDDVNSKPNYLSVMNYAFALREGVLTDNGPVLDFSSFTLAPLDENELDEDRGVWTDTGSEPSGFVTVHACVDAAAAAADEWWESGEQTSVETREPSVGGPIDWDCDGSTDATPVDGVIHNLWWRGREAEPDEKRVLESRNDWETITFTGGSRGGLESIPYGEPEDDDGFTVEAYRATPKDHAVFVGGPGNLVVGTGVSPVRVPIMVENLGENEDSYVLEASASGDWTAEVFADDPVVVQPGETVEVPLYVSVPKGVEAGQSIVVDVRTSSTNADWVSARTSAWLTVGEGAAADATGSLAVVPQVPTAGGSFTVTGQGLAPGADALLVSQDGWFDAVPVVADEAGMVAVTLVAPGSETTGTIRVVGESSEGRVLELAAVVEVRSAVQPLVVSAAAAWAVTAGLAGAALWVRRRRGASS